jgi:hypothetical protein
VSKFEVRNCATTTYHYLRKLKVKCRIATPVDTLSTFDYSCIGRLPAFLYPSLQVVLSTEREQLFATPGFGTVLLSSDSKHPSH